MNNDEQILEFIRKKGIIVDIFKGIVISNGKEIGAKRKRSVDLSFCINKKNISITRGRLIWIMKNGPVPENHVIVHESNDFKDDRISNLKSSTFSEIAKNAAMSESWSLRRKTPHSILTKEIVIECRKLVRQNPSISFTTLSEKYGVRPKTISAAVRGIQWSNITEEPPVIIPANIKKIQKPRSKIKNDVNTPKKARKRKVKSKWSDDVVKITRSLLKNNSTLSNVGILKFLHMRNLCHDVTMQSMSRLANKIREEIKH